MIPKTSYETAPAGGSTLSSDVEVVARVAAVDPQGRVLLTQRAGRDYWVLPGGHVDPGEPLPTAARREAAEEAQVPVEVGPLLCVWEVFHGRRHMLQCAFLGRIPGDVAAARTEDLGPTGGARHRRLIPLEDLGALRVFPAALATPGFQALIRRSLQAWGTDRDTYLGMEGAVHLTLPHRLNTRMIVIRDGRLLLVSDDSEAFWVLPGGLVQPEETLGGALVRETAEETGLRTAPERLLYVREFVDDHLREHGIECYFLGRVTGGDVRMGADPAFQDISSVRGQVTRARWFDRDALRRIVVYPDALRDRLWEDLAAAIPDRYLGTARLD